MTEPALALLGGEAYRAYAYSYPHKTAYRPFARERSIVNLFAQEPRDALSLYLHVPFCERRCGYCNLFARSGASRDEHDAYLAALERQARSIARALPGARFARLAVGGGTPAVLGAEGLERLLDIADRILGAPPAKQPTSVELSPASCRPEILALLEASGVSRVSLGLQSFDEGEARAVGRLQTRAELEEALDRIRARRFAVVNLDLMYGLPGQDERSLEESLLAALRFRPEELYLYPLYVRPGTALAERAPPAGGVPRRALYQFARDLLCAAGYRQRSMRHFALPGEGEQPADHRCQEDGMVGLGCGARCYTRSVHWCEPFAVDQGGIAAILAAYVRRSEDAFERARHGYDLDHEDERRRTVILTLLSEGLDAPAYRARFGSDPMADLPELALLAEHGLARSDAAGMQLTALGLELSDAIGPFLFSAAVRARMAEEVAA